jgi:hypothetical protein
MPIIWESEIAKANRVDFKRRNTAYRLTNLDPYSKGYGVSILHTAVTALRECGMDYEAFYGIVEDGLDSMIKVENLGSAMKLIANTSSQPPRNATH